MCAHNHHHQLYIGLVNLVLGQRSKRACPRQGTTASHGKRPTNDSPTCTVKQKRR